jgi:hypothetical protein
LEALFSVDLEADSSRILKPELIAEFEMICFGLWFTKKLDSSMQTKPERLFPA